MSEPQEFTFKPALIGAADTWMIKDGHLMKRGGKRALDLSKVEAATWGDMTVRGQRSAWLTLQGDGEPFRVGCNDGGTGADRHQFLGLIEAISGTLNESARIRMDGGVGFSMAMFVLGVLGVLCGLFFVLAGVMDWVKRGNLYAILGGLAAAGFMGWLALSYAPWKQVVTVSAREFGAFITTLRSANT